MTDIDPFYRPYINDITGETAMLSDEQYARLGVDSPWRMIRPGDAIQPAEVFDGERSGEGGSSETHGDAGKEESWYIAGRTA